MRRAFQALAEVYLLEARVADAARLGVSPTTLSNYVNGHRLPGERVAQLISSDLRGRLSVAELRGWDWARPVACRFFPSDPMPLARADGSEVFRDRASDHDAVRYLRELALDCPSEVRAAVEVVLDHLRPPASEESAP